MSLDRNVVGQNSLDYRGGALAGTVAHPVGRVSRTHKTKDHTRPFGLLDGPVSNGPASRGGAVAG